MIKRPAVIVHTEILAGGDIADPDVGLGKLPLQDTDRWRFWRLWALGSDRVLLPQMGGHREREPVPAFRR